jgi:hypothetical protein
MPEDTRLELMRQLEAAEQIDESDARDPRISIIRKEDFFEQGDKAERALRELMYGYDVPQSQLADVLSIPPKSLSLQAKADLIWQLRDSIALNDRLEQNRLNDWVSEATIDTVPYDSQKAFAAAVIKELNIGADVHWDTLQQAVQPLPQPNSFSRGSFSTVEQCPCIYLSQNKPLAYQLLGAKRGSLTI